MHSSSQPVTVSPPPARKYGQLNLPRMQTWSARALAILDRHTCCISKHMLDAQWTCNSDHFSWHSKGQENTQNNTEDSGIQTDKQKQQQTDSGADNLCCRHTRQQGKICSSVIGPFCLSVFPCCWVCSCRKTKQLEAHGVPVSPPSLANTFLANTRAHKHTRTQKHLGVVCREQAPPRHGGNKKRTQVAPHQVQVILVDGHDVGLCGSQAAGCSSCAWARLNIQTLNTIGQKGAANQ
eukprot:1156523-Pelagomonas_calceolata.AAC.1